MTIDKYEILHPIGEGGFGNVMLAKDTRLLRNVAIKIMPYSAESLNEVEILKEVHFFGFPNIYDVITKDESVYLVMEYVEGMTLKEYLKKNKRVPYDKAVKWIHEIGEIIQFLHSLHPSVIYRDLKPSNIMITKDGRIKLIDFGAVFFDSHSGNEVCGVYGTKGYSAPELWKMTTPNYAADIYSMGVVLHEMLTGVHNSGNELRRPIREYDKSYPRQLEKIISKCMLANPKDRYMDVKDFLKDIDECKNMRIKEEIFHFLKKVIVVTAYLVSLIVLVTPLLLKELDEYTTKDFQITLIFFGCSFLLHLLLFHFNKHNSEYEIKKKIWLTSKDYLGLLGIIFLVMGTGTMIYENIFENAVSSDSVVADSNIWVDIVDTDERNILMSEGSVFDVDDMLRLEISSEELKNDHMKIQVIAYDDDGTRYESRRFDVRKQ
ncbi:MAG: serine/threonine protein kinase [Lachnospiraceae bacterium]|nr:serine/threonine protein kinase [Lachnospiraceae bacterium]